MWFNDLVPRAPLPEQLFHERWKWIFYTMTLTIVMLLQILSFDYIDVTISGILLLFAWRMLRDNMQEMPAYALMYGVLCGLNCSFTMLPLVGNLASGRMIERKVRQPTQVVNRTFYQSWDIYTEIAPFFDLSRGFLYNVESLSDLLAPLCMAYGCYLSVQAHLLVDILITRLDEAFPEEESPFQSARTAAEGLLPPPRYQSGLFTGKVFKVDS
ncbi:unnamed protein product [Effrenium voratum]|nr:unnamed protein product [Effrenium voratum]|mmetsp:Transcript_93952/g.223569  ORF Transcript_93952/g.223569 Transcript_93952/m.223569 type:complete len:213 (-) Transcript_93952:56-694(-)